MNSIQEKFQELREDYSVANAIRYTDYLENCTKSDVIGCFENTFIEPIKGAEFTKKFILLNSFTENELQIMKASMESFINNAENNLYENYGHVEAVRECIQLIDAKLEHVSHISMVDLMLESMYLSEMEVTCEGAEISDKELKKIISNDVADDVKKKYANRLIARIKAGEVPLNTIKGANIIITTTAAVIYYAAVIPLSIISVLLPIPVLMVSSAINQGISKANYKICKRILESEIKKVEAAQPTNNVSDTLMTYLQNLQQARELLMAQEHVNMENALAELDEQESLGDKVKILDMAISENFIKFAFSEEETVEESIEWFNNIISLTNVKNVLVEQFVHNKLFDELEEELDELEQELDFDEGEEEFVEEGTKSDERRKKVNVAANKIKSKAQKVKDNIKKGGQATKAAANQAKNAGNAVDDALTNTVNKAKSTYRNDIREEIVEDKTRVKLFRIVRKGIGIGVATAVNPALGAITALVTYALNKKVKEKERRRILHELNEELEIVNEKIEDARGDSDKEKKYQLMRIRNQLKRDINRIQYRIKSDGKGV